MGIRAHGVFAIPRNARYAAIILALLLFGLIAWFGMGRLLSSDRVVTAESSDARSGAEHPLRLPSSTGEALTDHDSDGLKDWEEAIWRTDPAKPDTDADGTTDGEEVAAGRDPTRKGPGDELGRSVAEENRGGAIGPQNLTYQLSQSLFSSGALSAVDQNGEVVSTDFLNRLDLPQALDPKTLLEPARPLTSRDLTLSPDNSPDAVRAYFTALTETHRRYFSPYQARPDLVIFEEAVQSRNYAALSELDPLIAALERAVAEIKGRAVPSAYVAVTVEELNYLLKTKRAIEIFRNTEQDPMAAVLAIQGRLDLVVEMAKFHAETLQSLRQQGIL